MRVGGAQTASQGGTSQLASLSFAYDALYRIPTVVDAAGTTKYRGHEKLDTTAIYTEVSIKQLQEVHARCHPTAQAVPAPNAPGGEEDPAQPVERAAEKAANPLPNPDPEA